MNPAQVSSILLSGLRSPNLLPGLLSISPGPLQAPSALDIAASLNSNVPEGMLGAIVPLYKLIAGIFKRHASIDIFPVTQKAVILTGAAVGLRFIWSQAKPLLLEYPTSSITLPIEHHTAKNIQKWIEARGNNSLKRHREFIARKLEFNVATQADEVIGEPPPTMAGGVFFFHKHPLYISYQDNTAQATTQKERLVGEYDRELVYQSSLVLSGHQVTARFLMDTTGCLLERFTEEVASEEVKERKFTPVFTVSSSARSDWTKRLQLIRPLDTIDLAADIKTDFVNDLDKFLSPTRRAWYAARGIPYKRGYLLNGPPGTGKSSISLALAGHVKSQLYTIALGEVLGETHLKNLFNSIGRGSIVLLEDVDSAGITREKMKVSKDDRHSNLEEQGFGGFGGRNRHATQSRAAISLSGLLNAIDALRDGVVLIMTTNKPETLDKALIRPGRIDKQINMGYANQDVAANIFKRFYSETDGEHGTPTEASTHISELAQQFATKIPQLKLTPAEIQGFLIPLSDSPEEALVKTDKFVSDLLAAKAAGKNIIEQDWEEVAAD